LYSGFSLSKNKEEIFQLSKDDLKSSLIDKLDL